jgi:hypothetical protein
MDYQKQVGSKTGAAALEYALAEIARLRAALWPFAMNYQIKSGYCDDDFRRASEAMGELPIERVSDD